MITKTISYYQLKYAVREAFLYDTKAFDFFDKTARITTMEELVDNVLSKIGTHENPIYKGVFYKAEIVGYFVYDGDSLISFAVNAKYRTRKILRGFFSAMKNEMTRPFFCVLWSRNVRAVKYMLKHGCIINDSNPLQTQLVYT
jgi:hypothetical protein